MGSALSFAPPDATATTLCARLVLRLPQCSHCTGASASRIARRSSVALPQASHTYSYTGIVDNSDPRKLTVACPTS